MDVAIKGGVTMGISYKNLKELINKRVPEISGWIPLSQIKYFVPNDKMAPLFAPNRVRKPDLPSFILPGDWDKDTVEIEGFYANYSTSYRSVFQIFEEGLDYRKCDEYLEKKELIQNTGHSARGKTIEELDQYFEDLIKLKTSIEKDGYKTQKELGREGGDEIGIFLGRSGEFIKAEDKFCGTHRFAIAKFLQISKVYVTVVAVHEEWAKGNVQQISDSKSGKKLFLTDESS